MDIKIKKILLIISILFIFVIITFSSSNILFNPSDDLKIPIVDIEARQYDKTITLVHRGGDQLDFNDIKIILNIDENKYLFIHKDFEKIEENGNDYWEILESISISHKDISYNNFNLKIVDKKSNSELFIGFN